MIVINNVGTIVATIVLFPIYLIIFIKKIISKLLQSNHIVFKFFIMYYVVAFLIYWFGPIEYPKINVFKTCTYLFCYLISLIIGYYFSTIFKLNFKREDKIIFSTKLFTVLTLFSIILSIFVIISTPNILNYFERVLVGLTNPRDAYLSNIEISKSSNVVTQLSTLFSPIMYMVLPIGFYQYNNMKYSSKVLYIIYVILELFSYISKGTNFGIFKVAIIFATMYGLKYAQS